MRIVQANDGMQLINQVYKNRYLGAFPALLSMSQNNKQYLIANCTCVNGTIYFLDPVSLNVLNQSKIKTEEMKISNQLNRILYTLKPFTQSLPPFEKLFATDLRVDGKVKYITSNRFKKYMTEDLNVPSLSTQDIDEVIQYLDIDED